MKNSLTLVDLNFKALLDTVGDTLSEAKGEILGEKVLDVEAKSLVDMVSDKLTEAEAETLNKKLVNV